MNIYFPIRDHLFASHSLFNCQWEFQPNKSTVSALLDTTYLWLQHLERGETIGAVFFDFRKSFNSILHSPLLSKLHAIGLDPGIISWVHNYLADRHQFVVYNGASSDTSPVVLGVPQGSILGPPLYIDDISLLPGSMQACFVCRQHITLPPHLFSQ